MSPKEVIDVLEQLVEEGRLSRRAAAAIEEKVFQKLTPTGEWR
jgi:hypothetical protein